MTKPKRSAALKAAQKRYREKLKREGRTAPTICVSITSEQRAVFINACNQLGTTPNAILKNFITKFCENFN